MDKPTLSIIILSLATAIAPALYGTLGSAGFYIHEIIQDPESFNWKTLFLYCFLGTVVGLMVHNMMLDMTGHSYAGVLIACGFSVRRISEIADKYAQIGVRLPKK